MLARGQKRFRSAIMVAIAGVFLFGIGLGLVYAACVPAPSGLVSWWPGDGDAADIVSGYDGTLYGDTTYAPGKVGEAFSFDGSGDVIWVHGSYSIDVLNEFTIETWVWMNSLYEGEHKIQRFVTLPWEKAFLRWESCGTFGQLVFAMRTSVGPDVWEGIAAEGALGEGVWHHLATTFDGSTMRLYVDGGEVGSNVVAPGTVLPLGHEVELSSSTETLDGMLDEVAIYNRALEPGEIWNIYQAGSEGKCKAEVVLQNLISVVAYLDVQPGIRNSLEGKLDAVARALNDGNANNDVAAVNALEAFINAVEAQSGKKIDDSDADMLIGMAEYIIAELE